MTRPERKTLPDFHFKPGPDFGALCGARSHIITSDMSKMTCKICARLVAAGIGFNMSDVQFEALEKQVQADLRSDNDSAHASLAAMAARRASAPAPRDAAGTGDVGGPAGVV